MPADGSFPADSATVQPRGAWDVAAVLAGRQHDVVSLGQLVGLGVRDSTIRSWVSSRRLLRLHQGVYALGHRHLREEGHYLAAVLACGPEAVLSHLSAAALWRIRGSAAAAVDVTSPLRTGRRKPGLRVHRGERLHPDETTEVHGVPCTTVARTLLDLGSVRPQQAVDSAIESAERLDLLDRRAAALVLIRHRGRRGAGRLRAGLAGFNEEVVRARSETEARLFHLCVDSGLPEPLVNRIVEVRGERFEVDLHWPTARLIVEVDSPFHDTTAARLRDAHRDASLKGAGWIVIRCRWEDIVLRPERLIADIRGSIARRVTSVQ